jgi:hypothetical protein
MRNASTWLTVNTAMRSFSPTKSVIRSEAVTGGCPDGETIEATFAQLSAEAAEERCFAAKRMSYFLPAIQRSWLSVTRASKPGVPMRRAHARAT